MMGGLSVSLEWSGMPAVYVVVAVVLLAWLAAMLWRKARAHSLLRRARAARSAGEVRTFHALMRLAARRIPKLKSWSLRVWEPSAWLWSGEFTRAIEMVDGAPTMGVGPLVIKLEALIFDGRVNEAAALFDAHASTFLATTDGVADVLAIRGFLAFHAPDLLAAREHLTAALREAAPGDPIVSGAQFYLAAIAHRLGEDDAAKRLLAQVIREGGDRFVARWAEQEYAEAFPGEEVPPRPTKRPRRRSTRHFRNLLGDLWLGVGVLFLRTQALRTRSFTRERLAWLVVFDVCLALGLRRVDYEAGSTLYAEGVLAVVAPIFLFLVPAAIATDARTERASGLRLLGGFYAALPMLLVLSFAAGRTFPEKRHVMLYLELPLAVWSLIVFSNLARTPTPRISVLRWLSASAVFVAAWILPMHVSAREWIFYPPVPEWTGEEQRASNEQQNEVAFSQAETLQSAEASLATGSSGVTDLYFVGAAGWASQDVFLRELRSARALMDDRFGTAGRSLLLANDPTSRGELAFAANVTLRHALKSVGARMNRGEDILFLFVTSHGSSKGIALGFSARTGFRDETLRPADLRGMLDEAGIKWRVLVIAGCETGVFIEPLRNDDTLIATAASNDRESYGCATGNAFTDFGRAVFAEELVHERSFVTAFQNAAATVARREAAAGLLPSRPQIAKGAAIADKLREIEGRVAMPASTIETSGMH